MVTLPGVEKIILEELASQDLGSGTIVLYLLLTKSYVNKCVGSKLWVDFSLSLNKRLISIWKINLLDGFWIIYSKMYHHLGWDICCFFFVVIYQSCYQLNFDKSKVLVGEEVHWTSLASGTQESVYSSIVKIVFLKQLKLFGIFIAL